MTYGILFIFGTAISLSVLVLCNETPTASPNMVIDDCQRDSMDYVHTIEECIEKEFTRAKINETAELFNGTKCLPCNHICRKKDAMMSCIRETAESLKVLSENSRQLVPFLVGFIEEGLASFCENLAVMIPVYGDEENDRCFRESRKSCNSHVIPLRNVEDYAFCDSTNPEFTRFNQGLICQSLSNFVDCSEKAASSCTVEVQLVATRIKSILRNTVSCSKYI